jgi:hypothetical protein
MIEVQLDNASRSTAIERAQIVRRLAAQPDETIDAVIHILNSPKKKLWEIAVQVISTIGYPRNARAIPILIAHVGDQNSLAWQEAVEALIDIGIYVVVPYLIFELWDKPHHEYWGADVEGICSMLCVVDREYAVRCGPMITYILSCDISPPGELDKGFLLQVLEKIGNDCANEKELLAPSKYMLEQIDSSRE